MATGPDRPTRPGSANAGAACLDPRAASAPRRKIERPRSTVGVISARIIGGIDLEGIQPRRPLTLIGCQLGGWPRTTSATLGAPRAPVL